MVSSRELQAFLSKFSASWRLIFLVPFIACVICIYDMARGNPTYGDFLWACLALLFFAGVLFRLATGSLQLVGHRPGAPPAPAAVDVVNGHAGCGMECDDKKTESGYTHRELEEMRASLAVYMKSRTVPGPQLGQPWL